MLALIENGWVRKRLLPPIASAPRLFQMIAESLCAGAGIGAASYYSVRYAWWRSVVPWSSPRVLMYHMVRSHRPGTRFNKLRVPPECFARQLQWLTKHGFQFLFASELFGSNPPPEKSVCLTFDDGFADNLLHADPLLEQVAAKATLYLVTDRNEGWSSKKKLHHNDEELRSEPKLKDEQVQTMLESGRWELGAHTRRHVNLKSVDDATAKSEIESSVNDFHDRFHVVPPTFAYPFGLFEPRHIEMVHRAGYVGAVTTEPGIGDWPYRDPQRVPRIKISGADNMLSFAIRMRGGKRGLFK